MITLDPFTSLVLLSVLAVLLSVCVTVAIFALYRLTRLQKLITPGNDECQQSEIEHFALTNARKTRQFTPVESQLFGMLSLGLLLRNGLTWLAIAIIFLAVLAAAHPIMNIM